MFGTEVEAFCSCGGKITDYVTGPQCTPCFQTRVETLNATSEELRALLTEA